MIDDAHLLTPRRRRRLRRAHRGRHGHGRLIIAGRILADAIHEVTQLVDGLIIDSRGPRRSTPEEIVELPDQLDDAGHAASSRPPTAASA